jgi:hypothetical protein
MLAMNMLSMNMNHTAIEIGWVVQNQFRNIKNNILWNVEDDNEYEIVDIMDIVERGEYWNELNRANNTNQVMELFRPIGFFAILNALIGNFIDQ